MEQLIRASSAAKVLNMSRWTVLRMADQGKLPFVRTGDGMRLFRIEDVTRIRDERAQRKLARRKRRGQHAR